MQNTEHKKTARRPASLRQAKRSTASTPVSRGGLALGLSAAILVPFSAAAQSTDSQERKQSGVAQLPEVKARAEVIDANPNAQTGAPYKARTSGDSRHTRPLAETPQTLQVITKKAIEESGATDLRTILDAQPGITLGTGENGNAFGDRYIIRGQEARSDVFVDGLRDPGMTTRESFAVEQIEISKGPNSSFAGRGTVGGAINAITKQATLDYDFKRLSLGLGTNHMGRVAVDVNHIFTDELAVRLNALYSEEGVPDRSPADRQRKGIALSGLYEFSPDLSLTLDYYGLRANDMPDLGRYLTGNPPNRVPETGVPVYAQNEDFQKSDVDTGTARIRWRLSPDTIVNSLTRYGTSDNDYVVTGARGTTAYAGVGDANPYATGGLSTHNGWQEVKYLAHQTNLQFNKPLFGKKNEFIVGVEYTDHKVVKGRFNINNAGTYNCRTSAPGTANNAFCTVGPDGAPVAGLNSSMVRQIDRGDFNADWRIKTVALSVMDTIDLTDKFTLFSGLRFDHFNFDLTAVGRNGVATPYSYSDTLTNGHLGLSYKLQPHAIVYISAASAADINGGEADAGTNSGYGGAVIYNGQIAGAAPEKSKNFEIGTKWDLMGQRLLATAAVFQTTKSGVMEGADYDSVGSFNTGRNRVRGLELGLVGQLTDKLSAQAGLTVMKSRVMASATASNIGKPLSNFADKSAQVQLKYQTNERFAFGGAAKYESERCAGQPDTAAGINADGYCTQPVPAYTVLDLFASYRFNRHLEARVNLLNATNKDYYLAAYRSGSFLYKGDGRAVLLTVDYEF